MGYGQGLRRLSFCSGILCLYIAYRYEYIEQSETETTVSTTNVVDDALSKVLSHDCGHAEPSEELSNATASVLKRIYIPPTCPMSSPSNINNNSQIKCKLLDWNDSGEIVAEGKDG
uniref:Uncharacterized protein n=1 Tax=Cucumis melo TaxID=3656 RepID=A0A9I9EJW1_CUCME